MLPAVSDRPTVCRFRDSPDRASTSNPGFRFLGTYQPFYIHSLLPPFCAAPSSRRLPHRSALLHAALRIPSRIFFMRDQHGSPILTAANVGSIGGTLLHFSRGDVTWHPPPTSRGQWPIAIPTTTSPMDSLCRQPFSLCQDLLSYRQKNSRHET